MGRVVFTMENCIVYNDETDCGACSEHCPTQAVSMVDFVDGLRIPHVEHGNLARKYQEQP
jgi:ferredoxin